MAKPIEIAPEKAAIAWAKKLERLLKNHPKGYWLFCTGSLTMLRKADDGSHAINKNECVDKSYIVYNFSDDIISMDGGDW